MQKYSRLVISFIITLAISLAFINDDTINKVGRGVYTAALIGAVIALTKNNQFDINK